MKEGGRTSPWWLGFSQPVACRITAGIHLQSLVTCDYTLEHVNSEEWVEAVPTLSVGGGDGGCRG